MYNAHSLAGRDDYTANRIEDVRHRYYNSRADDALVELAHQAAPGNAVSLAEMLRQVTERTQGHITNTLSASEVAGVYNTNRSVYENHFCVFIQPTDGAHWQASFFDALYALRTTNGVDTLFQGYSPAGAPIALSDDPLAPREARVQMYQPHDGSRRRIFRVPEILAPHLARSFEHSRQRLLDRWQDGEVDYDTLGMYCPAGLVFDYDDGLEVQRGLNMYDFMTARHNDMYLVWDEDDAIRTAVPGNGRHWVLNWLARNLEQLMTYEAQVRQAEVRGAPAPVVPARLVRRRSVNELFGRPRAGRDLRRNPFI
jgi:hypothetical protein